MSRTAATGSVFSKEVCKTGIASAFHPRACLRVAGERDFKMISSAVVSTSAE